MYASLSDILINGFAGQKNAFEAFSFITVLRSQQKKGMVVK